MGKSTLASMAFPDYPVINLDSPVERAAYEQLGPEEWIARYPRAIVDEAQKLPAVIETLKACYDRDSQVRYILLGSSQILLLEKVRESLAGRAALRALFPFTLPELLAATSASRLVEVLAADDPVRRPRPAMSGDLSHYRSLCAGQNALGVLPPLGRYAAA